MKLLFSFIPTLQDLTISIQANEGTYKKFKTRRNIININAHKLNFKYFFPEAIQTQALGYAHLNLQNKGRGEE